MLRSVAEHDWSAPPAGIDDVVRGADLGDLAPLAAFHGVAGCVYHSLRDNPFVAADVADQLRATYHRALLTHLQILADLGDIAPVLDDLGVSWFVVKGPVLAETVYPRPDLRGYTDLDIVVRGGDLGRVLEALEHAGGEVLDTNWTLLADEMKGEVHVRIGRGTEVDVHWNLINQAELRPIFLLPMQALHERVQRVVLPGCTVATLDPVDTLLHLCLHSCTSGANRLVWLKDIEQTIRGSFPWDEAVARSRAYRVGVVVAAMLLEARALIGSVVPDEVVGAFVQSRTWPAVISTAARLSHLERSSGRRSPLRLLARSTRTDTRSSAIALTRRGLLAFREPFSAWPTNAERDPARQHAGQRSEFLKAVAECDDAG